MTLDRLFLDTVFVVGFLNKDDQHHPQAKGLYSRVKAATEAVTTEAILTEVGNILSQVDRGGASEYIRQCYSIPNLTVVPVDNVLFRKAVDYYGAHNDKEWGLTDCISFVVMGERGLHNAATADHHFEQAGFSLLMSNTP